MTSTVVFFSLKKDATSFLYRNGAHKAAGRDSSYKLTASKYIEWASTNGSKADIANTYNKNNGRNSSRVGLICDEISNVLQYCRDGGVEGGKRKKE